MFLAQGHCKALNVDEARMLAPSLLHQGLWVRKQPKLVLLLVTWYIGALFNDFGPLDMEVSFGGCIG